MCVCVLTLRYSLLQRVNKACLQRRDSVPESRLRPVAVLTTSTCASPSVQLMLTHEAFPGCWYSALLRPADNTTHTVQIKHDEQKCKCVFFLFLFKLSTLFIETRPRPSELSVDEQGNNVSLQVHSGSKWNSGKFLLSVWGFEDWRLSLKQEKVLNHTLVRDEVRERFPVVIQWWSGEHVHFTFIFTGTLYSDHCMCSFIWRILTATKLIFKSNIGKIKIRLFGSLINALVTLWCRN